MDVKQKSDKGIVFGIQRFSVHDGPGIRTTVFLKGCNIWCKWCHNPEGISRALIIGYSDSKCCKCGECVRVCPSGCHIIKDGVHLFERDACLLCGKCIDACPDIALEKIGKLMSCDEVFDEIKKDKKYYEEHGGVTLSGGEPLLQKSFSLGILKLCRDAGIHCAVETNGAHDYSLYEQVLPYVDLILFDYKLTDPKKHCEFIGIDNFQIIENLQKLHDNGVKILVRCPIIAGINDTKDHFDAIAMLSKKLKNLMGVELLSYHKLGVSKAERIGTSMNEYETPSIKTENEWKSYVISKGGKLINTR